jgi:hypothetical protein
MIHVAYQGRECTEYHYLPFLFLFDREVGKWGRSR